MKNNPSPRNTSLVSEIVQSIKQVGDYGSVEIYIQEGKITQITTRTIKKTSSRTGSNGYKHQQTLDKSIELY